eukprot:TRINITY_DN30235_c0_g1_i1.p1 TRINITY_DN30235_c0_g1~~TRINITY_DN30235_c0_g1_i1.p1  ORF type:complete len:561 (+),score=128.96 TRINITY_DN30235_c0_g1_i1:211-1683(+)
MQPLARPALPGILTAMRQGDFPEAEAAAWTLGRLMQWHPMVVPDEDQAALFEICVARLRSDPRLSVEVCFCFDGLVAQNAATLPVEIFEPAVGALLDNARSATTPQAQTVLISSLTDVVGHSSEECVRAMAPLLAQLLRWASGCGDPGRLPDRLVSCLRALTARLGGDAVAPHAEELLGLYVRVSEAHFRAQACFDADTLRAAGALGLALGPRFAAGVPLLWPVLRTALQTEEDPEGIRAALLALEDVAKALSPSMDAQFAAEVMEAIATTLRRQGTELAGPLRCAAIQCLGAVGAALGPAAPPGLLPTVLALLMEQASAVLSEGAAERSAMGDEDSAVMSGSPKGGSPMDSRHLGGSLGEQAEMQRKVLHAVLQAYEDIVVSLQRAGTVPQLGPHLPGILDFACRLAGDPAAPTPTLRTALRLVGLLAAALPTELGAVGRGPGWQPEALARLASFGAACPGKAMRVFAAAVARLLPEPPVGCAALLATA